MLLPNDEIDYLLSVPDSELERILAVLTVEDQSLLMDQLEDAARLKDPTHLEQDLHSFIRASWSIVEPDTEFIDGPHLKGLALHLQAAANKVIPNLLVNVPPGPGWVENWVTTSIGRRRLKDVRVGDSVLTHQGCYKKVTAYHDRGELPCVRIVTHGGRRLIVTPDHLMYVAPGRWLRADELSAGDTLGVVHPTESHQPIITNEIARLLGYLVGDGSLTHATASFTTADEDMRADFKHCVEAVGFEWSETRRKTHWQIRLLGGKSVSSWLDNYGLRGRSSYDKFIPADVLASHESMRHFMGAYFSCDGLIDVRATRSRGSAYRSNITTVSEQLAYDSQHLLAMLGIVSRVRKRSRTMVTKAQPGGEYVYYNVEICSEEETARLNQLQHLCDRKRVVIQGIRERFDRVLSPDVVVDVSEVGHFECACITVEDDHSLTWNGLAVHNCMKSLATCVFFPAWRWTTHPGDRFLYSSYDQQLSTRDSLKTRTLLESAWYRNNWGERFKLVGDQNEKIKFANDHQGWRIATSVGGRGTGEHPDFVICDDPHNVKKSESEKEREAVIQWWDGTISSRGVIRRVTRIVIMQRLHVEDLSGHILTKDEGVGRWTHLCLPMEYEPDRMQPTRIGWNDWRTEPGELLWPEAFSSEMVRILEREMSPLKAAGQLQQRPTPAEGALFHRDWFVIVDASPAKGERVRYWDKAATEGGGDWTAGVLMCLGEDGYIYVEDVKRAQLSPGRRNQLIKQTAQIDNQRYRQQVDTWVEQEPGSGGKFDALHTIKMLMGVACYIDKVTGSKEIRAAPFASQAEVGNVRVVSGDWNEDFLAELEQFPLGKHDDQVDAAGGAFAKLTGGEILGMPDDILVSGEDPREEHRPFDDNELEELPDYLRELVEQSRETRRDRQRYDEDW